MNSLQCSNSAGYRTLSPSSGTFLPPKTFTNWDVTIPKSVPKLPAVPKSHGQGSKT